MSSSPEHLRRYISNLLSEEESSFKSKLSTNSVHQHFFIELSETPSSILDTLEALLYELQPSSDAASYYLECENRFKLFLIVSHLCSPNSPPSNVASQCAKFRDIVISKLHSLIFNLVFPCKAAIPSQHDKIKKIFENWSNQNTFELKSYMIKNILKDLNNSSTLYILNDNDFEEPPNLNEFLQQQQAQQQMAPPRAYPPSSSHPPPTTTYPHNTNSHSNIQHQAPPPYIQFPPSFTKSHPNHVSNEYNSSNQYDYHPPSGGPPPRSSSTYNNNSNTEYATYGRSFDQRYASYDANSRARGRGRGRGRGGGRARGRGRGRSDDMHFYSSTTYGHGPTASRGAYHYNQDSSSSIGYRGGNDMPPSSSNPRYQYNPSSTYNYNEDYNQMSQQSLSGSIRGTSMRSRTRSRSRERNKENGNVRKSEKNRDEQHTKKESDDEDEDEDMNPEQETEDVDLKELEALKAKSVIAGVNKYPDGALFRDEEKMWRIECETRRKDQRKERVRLQLKNAEERMDDEFEKFFDEGMKRWDLVKDACLDRRIWEWQVNLFYNDSQKKYGFGNSTIRNSPYSSNNSNKKR